MNSSIKKLPGTKKQFPFVKPVVDCRRRPAQPDQLPPDSTEQSTKKVPAMPAYQPTQGKPRNGFGYRGFGSTSISPVVPRDKITRPLPKDQDKSQPRPAWKPALKVQEEKPIITGTNPTDVMKPFKARPVPKSHYDKPFRPVLPSKKDQEGQTNIVTKLASRMWHKMVDPIFPPKKKDDEKPDEDEGTDEKREEERTDKAPLAPSPSEEVTDKVSPMDEGLPKAEPGLASRMWHSVVDPFFHPQITDDEKVIPAIEDEIQEPKTEIPEVFEDPEVDTPVVDPMDEKPDDDEATAPEDDETSNEAPDSVQYSSPEAETDKVLPVEDETEPSAQPGLASRVWHSFTDAILHSQDSDDKNVPTPYEDKPEEPKVVVPEVFKDLEVKTQLTEEQLAELVGEAAKIPTRPVETAAQSLPNRIRQSIVGPVSQPDAEKPKETTPELKDDEKLLAEAAGSPKTEPEHHKRPYSDSFLLSKDLDKMEEKRAANRKIFQRVAGEKQSEITVEPSIPRRRNKKQQDPVDMAMADDHKSVEIPKRTGGQKKNKSNRRRTGKDD